jgi:RNA polymerase sigma-70 factor (ECF subfamily)
MNEAELDRLMARLAVGEREAFDPLFRELHPRALRLARSKLGDDLGNDVAQSALLRVFARASDFEGGRPALPWFYALVANEIRGASRRRDATNRRRGPDEALEEARSASDPETDAMERELRMALARAVDALDEESALAIHGMLGDSPRPEIDGATFRKRVSRAYARLRAALGGYDAS